MIAALLVVTTLAVDTPLVSAQWLRTNLSAPNIVLFHIGPRPDYDSAHIAGARFINLNDIAAPRGGPGSLALELPNPATLDSALEAQGVSDDSRIVLYWSSGWLSPTTRVYLTLTWAGLGDRVSILDGGINAWRAAGGAVTRSPSPPVPPSRGLTLRPRSDIVVDRSFVRGQLTTNAWTIIDARNRGFWTGASRGSGTRDGRIPGSVSFPFLAVTDSTTGDRFYTPTQLRAMFVAAGAPAGKPVVAYCHIGQQATAVWFAARLAGYDVRLYDGSWQDWSATEDAPTITGAVTASEPRP